jgi:hypothetical protein
MASKSTTGDLLRVLIDQIDRARSRIDDAFLGELEKRLKRESPDQLFRQAVWMAVAHHLCVPSDGLASVSRNGLAEANKYWRELHTCLSCLLVLLPHQSFNEHPQAWRMRIELIGKAREEKQGIAIRELFEQRATLQNWLIIAEAQIEHPTSEERIPPNDKLGADRVLVGQLAQIFRDTTGKDPREHIRGNNAKDAYSGDFFDFANSILRIVGNRQSDAARGNMIKKQLRKVYEVQK